MVYDIYVQSPLASLRTPDVTNSHLVTHFKIPENSKNKNFNFINIAQNTFVIYLKYVFKCLFTSL